MEYRAYPVGLDGHLQAPTEIVAASDELAIHQVKQLLNGLPIELWQGPRMVGWFDRTSDSFIAERIREPATPSDTPSC